MAAIIAVDSNRRIAMAAFFVYRNGDDVPRDVTRVVVHPSVRVLPPKAFYDCRKLEETMLHEGLEEIGDEAFYGCFSLRRLSCPSTVVRIGARAFMGCKKLEEVRLNDGLEEIGDGAFYGCWSLRRLNFPPTVVRIGDRAFFSCRNLSAVEFAGILNVKRGAFALRWNSLERIGVPSRAFVVQPGLSDRNYTCRLVTDGNFVSPSAEFALIAPGCLTTLPKSKLTEVGNSIGVIMINGEGTAEDRLCRVRQVVRKEVRGEVSTILGLAFWKAKIDEAERALMGGANNYCTDTEGGRKRAKVGIALTQEAREGCRGEGKGKVIAQNVLPFLDGILGPRGGLGSPQARLLESQHR